MYKKIELQDYEVTKRAKSFQHKFMKLILGNPPGVCPISTVLAYLQTARSQTCGKCVPCRDGLEEVEFLLKKIQDGKADEADFERLVFTSANIRDSADCAIGYEAASVVYDSTHQFREEYESHIKEHACSENMGQKIPCVSFCPAHVDVPGYVALIKEGRYAEAVGLIRHENPFPTVCAFICEHPCEEKCRRNMIDSPINIRGLKKYAVDKVAADHVKIPPVNVSTGKTVAVVGGGPSGLTVAYYLALMGHKVVIYEKHDKLGGMLRYGIPNYRLPKNRLDEDIRAILSTGNIEVKFNVEVGKDFEVEQLEKEYDAVYIGIGAQIAKNIPIEGMDAEGVYAAVDMLGEIGKGNPPDYTGKGVVIVGGGNVAMDCARSAIRLKAKEVTLICRERQVDMTALPTEIQGAIEEGAELLTQNAPLRILKDENGKVCGFEMQPQIISQYNEWGLPTVRNADCPPAVQPCDIVLMAIGQDIVSKPFEKYGVSPRHTIITDASTKVKNGSKVFAGGDCVLGPATVIKAIAAGKVAALNIDEYMGYHHKYMDEIEIPFPEENNKTHIGRVNLTERSARERKLSFDPVENSMTDEEARQECSKCLRCDHFGIGVVEGGTV